MPKTEITRADIMPLDEYGRQRAELRRRMVALKRGRRIAVGPHAMLIFENWDTMWFQIQEMLFVEKGGEQQIADELHAYGPLVPNGRELVATLMIEVEDEVRRRRLLAGLGGIEDRVALLIGDERITAVPEMDVERTDASGKTSSVHFLHFPFDDRQAAAFRDGGTRIVVAIEHSQYGHMAVMPDGVRRALAQDLA
jgi:hypothetical protein